MQTSIKSRALKEFAEATATLANPAVQEWRRQGGKVVGYFCSYFPEEIITAAGFLPFRMRATGSNGDGTGRRVPEQHQLQLCPSLL